MSAIATALALFLVSRPVGRQSAADLGPVLTAWAGRAQKLLEQVDSAKWKVEGVSDEVAAIYLKSFRDIRQSQLESLKSLASASAELEREPKSALRLFRCYAVLDDVTEALRWNASFNEIRGQSGGASPDLALQMSRHMAVGRSLRKQVSDALEAALGAKVSG